MKRAFSLLTLGAAGVALLATHATAQRDALYMVRRNAVALPRYVPGEVVALFATAASQSAVEHALRDVGGVQARRSEFGGYYLLRLAEGVDEDAAVARLRGMP